MMNSTQAKADELRREAERLERRAATMSCEQAPVAMRLVWAAADLREQAARLGRLMPRPDGRGLIAPAATA